MILNLKYLSNCNLYTTVKVEDKPLVRSLTKKMFAVDDFWKYGSSFIWEEDLDKFLDIAFNYFTVSVEENVCLK